MCKMSIRTIKWATMDGRTKQAWMVVYADEQGFLRRKTFKRKRDAEEYHEAKKTKRTCFTCGEIFTSRFRSDKYRYCSKRCLRDAREEKRRNSRNVYRDIKCHVCRAEFRTPQRNAKYCSQKCRWMGSHLIKFMSTDEIKRKRTQANMRYDLKDKHDPTKRAKRREKSRKHAADLTAAFRAAVELGIKI